MKCKNYKMRRGIKWYRKKIVEMVGQIKDVWILEQIYKFVINMTEEGD